MILSIQLALVRLLDPASARPPSGSSQRFFPSVDLASAGPLNASNKS